MWTKVVDNSLVNNFCPCVPLGLVLVVVELKQFYLAKCLSLLFLLYIPLNPFKSPLYPLPNTPKKEPLLK